MKICIRDLKFGDFFICPNGQKYLVMKDTLTMRKNNITNKLTPSLLHLGDNGVVYTYFTPELYGFSCLYDDNNKIRNYTFDEIGNLEVEVLYNIWSTTK